MGERKHAMGVCTGVSQSNNTSGLSIQTQLGPKIDPRLGYT